MKRLPFFLIVLTTLIILGGAYFLSRGTSNPTPLPSPTTHEYFFSPTCPHCANVNTFMDSWEDKDSFALQKYDVSAGQNSDLFTARGKSCGISPSTLGVPFLFTPAGECIVGDTPIINYLKAYVQNN